MSYSGNGTSAVLSIFELPRRWIRILSIGLSFGSLSMWLWQMCYEKNWFEDRIFFYWTQNPLMIFFKLKSGMKCQKLKFFCLSLMMNYDTLWSRTHEKLGVQFDDVVFLFLSLFVFYQSWDHIDTNDGKSLNTLPIPFVYIV